MILAKNASEIHYKPRVVIYRTGHLGDTVCAIPAFRLLRNHFCDAPLYLLCDTPIGHKIAAQDVVKSIGIFDHIVSYRSGRGLRTVLELKRLLRWLRPDILVHLPQLNRSKHELIKQALFFRLTGIHELFGFRSQIYADEWQPNEPNRLISLLNGEGFSGAKPDYAIPLDHAAQSSLDAMLQAAGISSAKPYVVFCGGGKAASQRWSLKRYALVLAEIAAKLNIPIIAVGAPPDIALYEQQILPFFPNLYFLRPSLSLPELTELLRSSLAYFGNDTGPMHLAAAVGCPTVAVMSARNRPGQWDPDVSPRLLIRHRTDCEGCWLVDCRTQGHKCMNSITSDSVIQQALPFLQSLILT